ncbi:hypothetical protein [Umezawaea sp. Da 62-37]|uniref:hypothetical protein n=1 Tax=Umezawaea sp. Da 62-37 TaxID=3075927 RepID=UPI0028F6D8F0|nr:hypothetical protein [Umezawaea sp. Da 62-37]WNV82132.1 hypothetical protein RM788_28410 [Umezawaea sp. Da 62-37]
MWRRIPISDEVLGRPRRVRGIKSSPRSRVWSAEFDGTPAVVKQSIGGPNAGERYEREVTGLRLAARADPRLAPRLLGVQPDERIMVLERVPVRRRVSPSWVAYAEGLARLHGVTTAEDAGALPAADVPTADDLAAFRRVCAEFGLTAPDDELEPLPERLSGGHQLIHGDPCVGNALPIEGRTWFLDFEHAALGNGLTELAYLRIGFPTCWNTAVVPEAALAEAEAAYRALRPDQEGTVAEHCVGWLLRGDALVERAHRDGRDHLGRLLVEDWKWGWVGARQRFAHRLGVVARFTEPEFAATSALASALRDRVVARWPEAARPPREVVQILE